MAQKPSSGGEPETIGKCTDCGAIYTVQKSTGSDVRPVGTDGSCRCGNAEFDVVI